MTIRRIAALALAGALSSSRSAAAPATSAGPVPALEVEQILERNAAARGGLEAWREVHTMAWTGHVERADGSGPRAPFIFEQRRPNLTRFEVVIDKERSVRVFDGRQGWKLHANERGQPQQQPYGDEEVRAARDGLAIDGPLLDAAAKGIAVTLDGLDEVEGREAFRLVATLPSGTRQRVWVDARSFLEVKFDRPVRDASGRPTTVAVYLRNYQAFDGLQIPLAIETGTPGGGPMIDRLVIERVAVNPNLPDGMFARPGLRTSRRGIVVDTRAPP